MSCLANKYNLLSGSAQKGNTAKTRRSTYYSKYNNSKLLLDREQTKHAAKILKEKFYT